MTKLTKIFLLMAVAGFVAGGVIDACGSEVDPKWTVVLPLGAVFFGLFLIFLMLQKEMAAFDQDEAAKLEQADRKRSVPAPPSAAEACPGASPMKHQPL